jgi:leucyl/phenylalanyl-tRNA--protein transferase
MKQILRSQKFHVTYDTCFKEVIQKCKSVKRNGQDGTWITAEMEVAYVQFYERGYAHSVEVWENNELVGGLYGVSMGRVFYGESMFAKVSNASKFGFIKLVTSLKLKGFKMIDSQDYTAHLESLGAREIPRFKFEQILESETSKEGKVGKWTEWL